MMRVEFREKVMQGDQTQNQSSNSDQNVSKEAVGTNSEINTTESQVAMDGITGSRQLEQEITELKDKYIRVHAEMENMRRRQERERADLLKYGLENVFKDLLPVLDSLEKALPEGADRVADQINEAAYYDGMMMVKKQLLEVCRKHGLEAVEAANAPFDPNLHQAIQRLESSEVNVDTVANEFARGYQLHGRLLRPAMVSVLTPVGS
jgi:molecular chaperone GrpE